MRETAGVLDAQSTGSWMLLTKFPVLEHVVFFHFALSTLSKAGGVEVQVCRFLKHLCLSDILNIQSITHVFKAKYRCTEALNPRPSEENTNEVSDFLRITV